jgi:hypothetical protein
VINCGGSSDRRTDLDGQYRLPACNRDHPIANVSGTAREKSRRTICDFSPKNRTDQKLCSQQLGGTRQAKGVSSRPPWSVFLWNDPRAKIGLSAREDQDFEVAPINTGVRDMSAAVFVNL